jgi:hypothetical protein
MKGVKGPRTGITGSLTTGELISEGSGMGIGKNWGFHAAETVG